MIGSYTCLAYAAGKNNLMYGVPLGKGLMGCPAPFTLAKCVAFEHVARIAGNGQRSHRREPGAVARAGGTDDARQRRRRPRLRRHLPRC